jgi:hypothetical protein
MKDLFVNYELAVKLKEAGFNKGCLSAYYERPALAPEFSFSPYLDSESPEYITNNYRNQVAAPLYQQVIDWLREENKIVVEIHQLHNSKYELIYTWHVYSDSLILTQKIDSADKLYYRCLQSGIEKAIGLIQKN